MKNRITEEEFEEQYKPQDNHIVGPENASFNGKLFETYGEELHYVLSLANNKGTANRVWTIIEGDEGMCYAAGYHLVNRIGYIITERPFDNHELWVELDEDFD